METEKPHEIKHVADDDKFYLNDNMNNLNNVSSPKELICATTDDDIANKMLSALISDDIVPQVKQTKQPSIEEQIHYLKRWVDSLSIDDRRGLANILIMNNKKAELQTCLGGLVVNLDKLPYNIINQMYSFMLYKREQKK